MSISSYLADNAHRPQFHGEISLQTSLSSCGSDSAPNQDLGDTGWVNSIPRRAAEIRDSSLLLRPNAQVDSTRVYGELELTRVAKPLDDGLPERPAREDSVARNLSLPRDAVVAFIVERTGRVEPRSIHVMDAWSAADRRRIAAAVSSLRYRPAYFGGVPVAQRAHYLIPAR